VPRASAGLNLRIPPGTEPEQALASLTDHLTSAAPWGVEVTVETEAMGGPFRAATDGPAYDAMRSAMHEAFGELVLGQGGSIPLCNVFAESNPDAVLILMGLEEPFALIHALNESVDPAEIQRLATAEAIFLQRYAASPRDD
jgi:acetylornithine deacetylase/succinyl-diaminopimelate desuccinylase-like protein